EVGDEVDPDGHHQADPEPVGASPRVGDTPHEGGKETKKCDRLEVVHRSPDSTDGPAISRRGSISGPPSPPWWTVSFRPALSRLTVFDRRSRSRPSPGGHPDPADPSASPPRCGQSSPATAPSRFRPRPVRAPGGVAQRSAPATRVRPGSRPGDGGRLRPLPPCRHLLARGSLHLPCTRWRSAR